jgi:hypothetical protein
MAKNKAKEQAKELRDAAKATWFNSQPTPALTCSKVYYLKLLQYYNFCVHSLASGMRERPLVDPRKSALALWFLVLHWFLIKMYKT